MRHVRILYPFLTDKEIEVQGPEFKAWLRSDQLSDLDWSSPLTPLGLVYYLENGIYLPWLLLMMIGINHIK